MTTEEYDVEKLIKHRASERTPGTIEYLIKWKGYKASDNSWEREVNVFSKDMINEYWKNQKISKSEFLKSIKSKRKSNDSDHSKTATAAAKKKAKIATAKKHENKNDTVYLQDSTSVKLCLQPRKGLNWSNLKKIVSVYHSPRFGLFSEAKWSNDTVSFIPNTVLREYQPSVLIQYYESRLEFGP